MCEAACRRGRLACDEEEVCPIDYSEFKRELEVMSPAAACAIADTEADWSPKPAPSTLLMADVARAILALRLPDAEPELDAVLAVVERAITVGDDHTRAAVATGFLEALINDVSRPGLELIVERLGPESKAFCRGWDEFTGLRTPGLG